MEIKNKIPLGELTEVDLDEMSEEEITLRIEEIEEQMEYCERRDRICLSVDGEAELFALEEEYYMLNDRLNEI